MYSLRTQSFPSPSPRWKHVGDTPEAKTTTSLSQSSKERALRRRRTQTGVFPSPTAIIKSSTSSSPSLAKTSSRRTVSFDESRNQVYRNQQWNKKQCLNRWYPKKEITLMKEYSQALARGRRHSRAASDAAYKRILLSVYDECCAAPSEDAALSTLGAYSLRVFVGKSHSRVGLEKTSVGEIDHDKKCRRGDLVEAVLDAQETFRAGKPAVRAELIRVASERVSLPGRLFARHIATALAASLRGDA